MDKEMYHVQIGDTIREYPKGTTYLAIAKEYQKDYEDDIVLVVAKTQTWDTFPLGLVYNIDINFSFRSRFRIFLCIINGRFNDLYCIYGKEK